MLIDSGSDLTLINLATAKRLKINFQPPGKLPRISAANGSHVKIAGIIKNAHRNTTRLPYR